MPLFITGPKVPKSSVPQTVSVVNDCTKKLTENELTLMKLTIPQTKCLVKIPPPPGFIPPVLSRTDFQPRLVEQPMVQSPLVQPASAQPPSVKPLNIQPPLFQPLVFQSPLHQPPPVQHPSVQSSPVKPSPVQHSPVQPSPVQPSPVQPSPVQPSPVQPSLVHPSTVQPSPVQPSPVQHSPVQPSPVQPSLVHPSTVQPSPVRPYHPVQPPHVQAAHIQPPHIQTPHVQPAHFQPPHVQSSTVTHVQPLTVASVQPPTVTLVKPPTITRVQPSYVKPRPAFPVQLPQSPNSYQSLNDKSRYNLPFLSGQKCPLLQTYGVGNPFIDYGAIEGPSVERRKTFLVPKNLNPSLPDMNQLKRTSYFWDSDSSSSDDDNISTNPFSSPTYHIRNDSSTKHVKLGEDFFASLFNSSENLARPNTNSQCKTKTISDPVPQPVPSRNATTSVLRPMNPSNSASKPPNNPESVPDRYAALKDLDEIFKSTVVMNDSKLFKE